MKIAYLLVVCLLAYATLQSEEVRRCAIFTYKVAGSKPWDPDSINSGITGSEEAVIYTAQKLATLGYQVLVLGNPPAGSDHSREGANPRYVDVESPDTSTFDIAISWRQAQIAQELKKRAKKVYLWPHDTFHWALSEEMIDGFDDVLWISEWQRNQWISVNPGFDKFTNIFGNGINPEQFLSVLERENPYSCIYSSNYARGLDILLNIWPIVKRKFPKASLDIYYGWQHWGLLSTDKEVKMRALIDIYSVLDVREHGLVGHEELNRAFEKTSFWTYPCTLPETFCITALRAQMSGAIPVIIKDTALQETVLHGYSCAKQSEYLATLLSAMRVAETITLEKRKSMREFILQKYTWEQITESWDKKFRESLQLSLTGS